MKVAINGFGRIGRAILRICIEKGISVVAINDIHGADDARYLLQYDSVYGKYDEDVSAGKDFISVGGKKVKVLNEMEPEKLPWKAMGVDIVIESSGVFTGKSSASKHLKAGAKYVLITAPAKGGGVLTIVPGVNEKWMKKNDKIISVASCTTNCLSPIAKVINDKFGIKRAIMTTVHAYTNDQVIQDSFHKKKRRGRAGALNIIPTTSGATEAVEEVIPELKGKITGLAVRVPVPCGSLVDFVAELQKDFDVDKINSALRSAASGSMKGIIEYSSEELVSSDVIGNSHSTVVDSLCTQKEGNMVKILAWYDNEYGYSCRVVDVIGMLKKFL